MKSLKTKGLRSVFPSFLDCALTLGTASRFFKDSPTQDEKVANADLRDEHEFGAGIHGRSPKRKRRSPHPVESHN
jgi:hypothetical protein